MLFDASGTGAEDAAIRLDAESALAFLDAVEQSAQVAPPHLVEELVPAAVVAKPRSGTSRLWLRLADGFRPAQRWRIVGACVVVLVASAAALLPYWEEPNQLANPPASVANTDSANNASSTMPAARPALAARQPCEPSPQAGRRP